jgi:hypothetical protein
VAIVGAGPESWEGRDDTQTEDAGLPEHERDETRRSGDTGFEEDAPGLAGMGDSGLDDSGLPEHEDDTRAGTDTATGEQNP